MTIEQKLEILKRAIESGAAIRFHIFAWEENQNGASVIANHFPEFEKEINENNETNWIDLISDDFDFKGSIFYEGKSK